MLSREKGIIPLLENMDLLLNEILVGSLSVSTPPHRFASARGGAATSALSTPGDRNLLLHPDMAPLRWKPSLRRTNISKTTVYRILKTFVHRSYLAQSQDGLYRLVARPQKARFGFGSQSAVMPFSEAVTESLKAASSAAGVDLIVFDNGYDGSTALHNADEFARNRVDLVIEFQSISMSLPCSQTRSMPRVSH
jgi:IclR-like helix-turn-helix domain-containing protein